MIGGVGGERYAVELALVVGWLNGAGRIGLMISERG